MSAIGTYRASPVCAANVRLLGCKADVAFAPEMSAIDPKRTSPCRPNCLLFGRIAQLVTGYLYTNRRDNFPLLIQTKRQCSEIAIPLSAAAAVGRH